MSAITELEVLFDHIFRARDKSIPATRLSDFSELLGNKVLSENEKGITIDYSHDNICTKLISLLEEHLGTTLSQNIEGAFSQIEEYHNHLKSRYKHNFVNAFDFLLDPLRVHLLLSFHRSGKVDVIGFKNSFSDEVTSNLHLFDKWFYNFLLKVEISTKQLLSIIEQDLTKESHYYVDRFLRELGKSNYHLAKELIAATSHMDYAFPIIRSSLIISIHNSETEDLFKQAVELLTSNNKVDFGTVARLNFNNDIKHLDDSFALATSESNEFWDDKAYMLCRIVENETTASDLRKKCFDELDKLLKVSKEVADASMNVISLFLVNYEEEKFKLLITYLATTKNLSIARTFFHQYKNPKYLFSLLVSYHKTNGSLGVNRRFQEPITHFWTSDRAETEKYIFDLFNPGYRLGLLPIEVILSHNGIAREIDLSSLPEDFQFNAIDCINLAPHSFEKLLPTLLTLRKSKHTEVIVYLQNTLKLLTTEAYGLLMRWLEENLLDENEFLKPVKEHYEEYQLLIENKEKYNDLNPRENERDLMELYYRLEHEQQAKMMKEVSEGGNSFMSMMKSVTIARGKSWKLEDQDVRPLSNIQHSTWVDYRRLADPISYEFEVKQFDRPL